MGLMQWRLLVVAVLVAVVMLPNAAQARTVCDITPSPVYALQPFTLLATGLPPSATLTLETYFRYDGHVQQYGSAQVTTDPDGTYSQSMSWSLSGTLTFDFSDATGDLASCSVRVK